MRPFWHPHLVNGRFGDPALYVEGIFERQAVLFDLGDIHALPSRKIIRIKQIFISHTHIDHFIGFDQLLRVLVGRDATIHLFGPAGLVDSVSHKLQAYRWNLFRSYAAELAFVVTEIDSRYQARTAQFRLKNQFVAEEAERYLVPDRACYRDSHITIYTAVLDHRTPCLGFAFEEAAHVNIWKNQLSALGLPVGPWLHALKTAVIENRCDDEIIRVPMPQSGRPRELKLGKLRQVFTVTDGQKIGYITDAAPTEDNRRAIIDLVKDADILFIEAPFAAADAALAAERAHLTTSLAGQIGRDAKVRRIEPFHFSSRYEGEAEAMLSEVANAFEPSRENRACTEADAK
jgi:ribonuclease Z